MENRNIFFVGLIEMNFSLPKDPGVEIFKKHIWVATSWGF